MVAAAGLQLTPVHAASGDDGLTSLSAVAAAGRLRDGALTSEQLVGACLERIEGRVLYSDEARPMFTIIADSLSPQPGPGQSITGRTGLRSHRATALADP